MARYFVDQNQVGFFYESGTYANASGGLHWIGQVMDHNLGDEEGVIETKYMGTGDRNINQFNSGPRDYTGTITYQPQDWKFLIFTLGSNVDSGSPSPYTHTISELNNASGNAFTSGTENPFISFGIEHSQKTAAGTGQNFVRTVKGAMVNDMTININNSEPITVDVNYLAQDVDYSSGAPTALTENTVRPFLWDDTLWHMPSGTYVDDLNSSTINISNNMTGPHYINGSRSIGVPRPGRRTYSITLNVDANSATTKTYYDQYFRGGSLFNMMLEINASTGSRDMFAVFSGCRIFNMEAPEKVDGEVNEQTITIRPKSSSIVVNDTTQKYNAW